MTPPALGGEPEGFDLAVREERELQGLRARSGAYPAPTAESGGGSRRSVLPGAGRPGDGCGDLRPVFVCKSHLIALVRRHQCLRRACPNCGGRCGGGAACPAGLPGGHGGGPWAHGEARAAADRFEDFVEQHRLGRIPLRQVIISPRPDRFGEAEDHGRAIAKLRSWATTLCRRFGWRGKWWGCTVVHLYRGCEGRGYSEWGPHAHAVCPGVDVGALRRYAERNDLVVKQVNGHGGGFASYRGFGLFRLLVYELGHSAVIEASEGRRGANHSLTWFGELHGWGQPPDPPSETHAPCCPRCGGEMEPWPWDWWPTGSIYDGAPNFSVAFRGAGHGTVEILWEGAGPSPNSAGVRAESDSSRSNQAPRGEPEGPDGEPASYPNGSCQPVSGGDEAWTVPLWVGDRSELGQQFEREAAWVARREALEGVEREISACVESGLDWVETNAATGAGHWRHPPYCEGCRKLRGRRAELVGELRGSTPW